MRLQRFIFLISLFISGACLAAPESQPETGKFRAQQPAVEIPVHTPNSTTAQTRIQNKSNPEQGARHEKSRMIDFCRKNPC
ncbi:MAG: hypothetical protein WAT53_01525 [Nitrosomonas sp.]|nr:hypothetical protein [Nitrosomonas sp.]MCC7135613.1 hypothetical protein [Nitrosomonas sp.]